MRTFESNGVSTTVYDVAPSGAVSVTNSTPPTATNFHSRLTRVFNDLFIPHGMSDEYFRFQLYDTIQGLCSYLRNIITTALILESIGVGTESASALAAALQWALKDGAGLLTSLSFSHLLAQDFAGYALQFRLFADVINDVGMLLDMLLPFVSREYLLYYSFLSTACKTMCGVSAGATRGLVTVHFCEGGGDLAEVTAKEATQETAITLVGIVLGVLLSGAVNETEVRRWSFFVILSIIHVVANVRAVRCLKFRSLNFPRLKFIVEELGRSGKMVSPAECRENPWCWWWVFQFCVGGALGTNGASKLSATTGDFPAFLVHGSTGSLRDGVTNADVIDCAVRVVGGDGIGWAEKLSGRGWNADDIALRVGEFRYRHDSPPTKKSK